MPKIKYTDAGMQEVYADMQEGVWWHMVGT